VIPVSVSTCRYSATSTWKSRARSSCSARTKTGFGMAANLAPDLGKVYVVSLLAWSRIQDHRPGLLGLAQPPTVVGLT
jgi:hypothetical protein